MWSLLGLFPQPDVIPNAIPTEAIALALLSKLYLLRSRIRKNEIIKKVSNPKFRKEPVSPGIFQ